MVAACPASELLSPCWAPQSPIQPTVKGQSSDPTPGGGHPVKPARMISKYLGEDALRLCKFPVSPLSFANGVNIRGWLSPAAVTSVGSDGDFLFPHASYAHRLKFCKEHSPLLHIYLFNQSLVYICVDSWIFILFCGL